MRQQWNLLSPVHVKQSKSEHFFQKIHIFRPEGNTKGETVISDDDETTL